MGVSLFMILVNSKRINYVIINQVRLIYCVDYCLIKLKTMSVGKGTHTIDLSQTHRRSVLVISYWYLCHIVLTSADLRGTKEFIPSRHLILTKSLPCISRRPATSKKMKLFRRIFKGASMKYENMLNLISSINNKYFDDIIIKDLMSETPVLER